MQQSGDDYRRVTNPSRESLMAIVGVCTIATGILDANRMFRIPAAIDIPSKLLH